jgi:hypothetical protein
VISLRRRLSVSAFHSVKERHNALDPRLYVRGAGARLEDELTHKRGHANLEPAARTIVLSGSPNRRQGELTR